MRRRPKLFFFLFLSFLNNQSIHFYLINFCFEFRISFHSSLLIWSECFPAAFVAAPHNVWIRMKLPFPRIVSLIKCCWIIIIICLTKILIEKPKRHIRSIQYLTFAIKTMRNSIEREIVPTAMTADFTWNCIRAFETQKHNATYATINYQRQKRNRNEGIDFVFIDKSKCMTKITQANLHTFSFRIRRNTINWYWLRIVIDKIHFRFLSFHSSCFCAKYQKKMIAL